MLQSRGSPLTLASRWRKKSREEENKKNKKTEKKNCTVQKPS
jgi:hypothetical protein